jgi:hypothetical protein
MKSKEDSKVCYGIEKTRKKRYKESFSEWEWIPERFGE